MPGAGKGQARPATAIANRHKFGFSIHNDRLTYFLKQWQVVCGV